MSFEVRKKCPFLEGGGGVWQNFWRKGHCPFLRNFFFWRLPYAINKMKQQVNYLWSLTEYIWLLSCCCILFLSDLWVQSLSVESSHGNKILRWLFGQFWYDQIVICSSICVVWDWNKCTAIYKTVKLSMVSAVATTSHSAPAVTQHILQ